MKKSGELLRAASNSHKLGLMIAFKSRIHRSITSISADCTFSSVTPQVLPATERNFERMTHLWSSKWAASELK